MKPLPCIDCITLPMCRPRGIMTNGVSQLESYCHMLHEWIGNDPEDMKHETIKLYAAYCYMIRGEIL